MSFEFLNGDLTLRGRHLIPKWHKLVAYLASLIFHLDSPYQLLCMFWHI